MKRPAILTGVLLAAAFLHAPKNATAFPFMIKHGYTQCRTCHHSPTGGGVLTAYGRELSREVLSLFGKDSLSDSSFAYGLLKLPEALDAIAEVKALALSKIERNPSQSVQDTVTNRIIPMQADLELAFRLGDFTFAGTGGYQDPSIVTQWTDHLISRRFFVTWAPTELGQKWSFRIGKFFPQIGVNTPEHAISTRRDLGWDEGQETYNFEVFYFGDLFQLHVIPTLGRLNAQSERGGSIGPTLVFDTLLLGLNYYFGLVPAEKTNVEQTRHLFSLAALWGLNSRWHISSELDLQLSRQGNPSPTPTKTGVTSFTKLDFEPTQGLHFNLTFDSSLFDIQSELQRRTYGVGVQAFLRPHTELAANWSYSNPTLKGKESSSHLFSLLLHYYL